MKKHAQWTPGKKALAALLVGLVAAGPALAQDVVKDNNTDGPDLGSSNLDFTKLIPDTFKRSY